MRYRKLSSTGDYTFGQGQQNFLIDSPTAVAQAVETTLRLWLGEWYLDVNAGTPYIEGVLGRHPDLQKTADNTIISMIRSVQGVVSIDNFKSVINPDTREYSNISGTLNTIYGQTELQIENQGNF